MKIVVLVALVLMLVNCGQTDQAKSDKPDGIGNKTTDRQAELMATSQLLIKKFSQELKSKLLGTMNSNGAPGAVHVCAEQAPNIAKAFSINGWLVRRVSDKIRNPENIASDDDRRVLTMFADSSKLNSFDEFSMVDSTEVYNFYKPIRISKLCLNCHGEKAKLDPEILSTLGATYPTDEATGYAIGDLRGMFVVKVSLPEGYENIGEMKKVLSE